MIEKVRWRVKGLSNALLFFLTLWGLITHIRQSLWSLGFLNRFLPPKWCHISSSWPRGSGWIWNCWNQCREEAKESFLGPILTFLPGKGWLSRILDPSGWVILSLSRCALKSKMGEEGIIERFLWALLLLPSDGSPSRSSQKEIRDYVWERRWRPALGCKNPVRGSGFILLSVVQV